MANAPAIPLLAYKRVPYDESIAWMGADWTGAAVAMEIRPEPGGTGTALVTLGASVGGAEGVAISYDADYPDPEGDLADGATILNILIDEGTLEALSLGADPAADVLLHYDIHLTPTGGKKFLFAAGTFTIKPGVTL